MGNCVKAILRGVDRSMWCYALRYFVWTWNRVPRAKYARLPGVKQMTPQETRLQRREERVHERDSSEHLGPRLDTRATEVDEFGKHRIIDPRTHNSALIEDEGEFL